MKHLAFLSFTIAVLIAPIQVQAQQYDPNLNCVRFPQIPNPDAEARYLLSHPGDRVCPGPNSRACPQLEDSQADYRVIHRQSADSELTDAPLRPSGRSMG